MSITEWVIGLKPVENYFEGYIEDVQVVRQKHQVSTVSTYGVRRSRQNTEASNKTEMCDNVDSKENEVSINKNVLFGG